MIVDGSENSDFSYTTELERVMVAGITHGSITEVIKRNTGGSVSAPDVSDNLNQEQCGKRRAGQKHTVRFWFD